MSDLQSIAITLGSIGGGTGLAAVVSALTGRRRDRERSDIEGKSQTAEEWQALLTAAKEAYDARVAWINQLEARHTDMTRRIDTLELQYNNALTNERQVTNENETLVRKAAKLDEQVVYLKGRLSYLEGVENENSRLRARITAFERGTTQP